jgi:hypothetical protein
MSYCSIAQAAAITGITLPQELLDEAHSILLGYTSYRWEETEHTYVFSGDGKKDIIETNSPIISVTSLVMDDLTYTEDVDFEVRKNVGMIKLFGYQPVGNDNITLIYKYGFTSAHSRYAESLPVVRGAEARIALYLKKNPGMLGNLGISGANLSFDDIHIHRLLALVPKPVEFTAI